LPQTRISLLVELLKTFKDKELIAFTKFVGSAYFNEDQKLIFLLKKLKQYALNAEKFIPEIQLKVYEATFCDKPLKQKELNKQQYDFLKNKLQKLLRLAEQFLSIENFKAKKNTNSEFLYKTLIDRNQEKLYQRRLNSDLKAVDEKSKKDVSYYSTQYKYQEAKLYHFVKFGRISKEDNYDELNYYLDIYYILEKLKYYLAQLSLKKLFQNKNYKNFSLEFIDSLLKVPAYAANPIIQTYICNINLVETESDTAYQLLLDTLATNEHKLPALFLRVFYSNLTNYCSAQIKRGNVLYYKKLFEIYKLMFEKDLLNTYNSTNISILKNIITVSCFVKEFDWANNMLERYKKFIPTKIRESVFCYNKGVIEFNQHNYSLAQQWFLKVDKINDTFEIGLRIFMLQCIFEIEQDYSDGTKQSFESTKQFFKRNKQLANINKKSYLNFVKIFTYIYQSKHKTIKMQSSEILEKLNKLEVVHKKQWLLNKIEEL